MLEIMTREVWTNDLKESVSEWTPDGVGKDMEKAWQSLYPLHDVSVRKVAVLKQLRFEAGKLTELRGGGCSSGKAAGDETGAEGEGALVQESAQNSDF